MTRLAAALCTLAWLLSSGSAAARGWVEKTIENDSATVELERDGSGVVSHEILMRMRGGPLAEFSVDPIDADADLLEGATVTRAESGRDAGFPIPLASSKDGARATFHVQGIKGLRSGTYQIRFRYRTNLATSSKIRASRAGVAVEFGGLAFTDGIDSERVVFRIPRGNDPPRLPLSSDTGGGADVAADDHDGVFLSTVRRSAEKDEIEVVRPHVAKGEIVDWKIVADRTAFDLVTPTDEPAPTTSPVPAPKVTAPPAASGAPRTPLVALIVALGVLYAGATAQKSRWVARNSKLRGAEPRSLLPFGMAARALLAGAGVVAASVCLATQNPPILALISIVVAIAAAVHLPPRAPAPRRGPGDWRPLEADVAFDGEGEEPLSGRVVDAGTPIGFLIFGVLLAAFVVLAIAVFRRSPYDGLGVALGASLLFPIFCTGRGADLPRSAAFFPRDLLEWLFAELGARQDLDVRPIGRVPRGAADFDELRLLVTPKRSVPGLVAIEVGLDCHATALGPLELPFVIVRVNEGSKAETVLPAGLLWTRGRTGDERVTVLRPKVPTRSLVRKLVLEVAERLGEPSEKTKRVQVATSAAKSSGSGSSTAKAGTRSSPAHAT